VYAIETPRTRASPFVMLIPMLLAQRGFLFLWVPIFLAIGIGGYFSLRFEPEMWHYSVAAVAIVTLGALAWFGGEAFGPVFSAIACILIGAMLAGARAHSVAEPVLGFRYYGPIEGRVVAIDRSSSDKVRVTLDKVVLARISPERTPTRVRVSLHGGDQGIDPAPGMIVMLTGHLSPPGGPVEPGGFDFGRKAWFDGLGAVGYSRSPLLGLAQAQQGGFAQHVFALRMGLSAAIQNRLEGQTGAFAAAIITGDRSGIDQSVLDDLRRSNLAHLLAISGLHMGLMTGVVFVALRVFLSLVPPIALRVPVKKIAAVGAIAAGVFYLILSGGNVSTQRAFVMALVMLVAVLLDRRAISLRAVALAALIVLTLRPESLTGPGFQMSFAATTGLVAVFGWLREAPTDRWRLPKVWRPVAAVVISSAVAGAATAPFSAAHFNQLSDYGLLANLLSVPLMGLLVMPAAVASAVLALVGLEALGLVVMGAGLDWIMFVAQKVSQMSGATTPVVTPGPWVLPVLSVGFLFAIIWQGRARLLGLLALPLAVVLWSYAERPDVLISESGGLVGIQTTAGRVLNKPKGDGFAARSWLENDGDSAQQADAFARVGFSGVKGDLFLERGPLRLRHLSGRGVAQRAQQPCEAGFLIVTQAPDRPPVGPCQVISPDTLRYSGALALTIDGDKVRVLSSRSFSGKRLWTEKSFGQ
jgi:competence protein ComEC